MIVRKILISNAAFFIYNDYTFQSPLNSKSFRDLPIRLRNIRNKGVGNPKNVFS